MKTAIAVVLLALALLPGCSVKIILVHGQVGTEVTKEVQE